MTQATTQPTKEQTTTSSELTAEEIFAIDDLPIETVVVPEWNDATIRLRTMTGFERDEFEAQIQRQRTGNKRIDLRGLKIRMIRLTAIKADGAPLFATTDEQDLNKKSSRALERLFKATSKLSGLSEDDVEELAGN